MSTRTTPLGTLVIDDSEDECQLLSAQIRHVASLKVIGFVRDGIEAVAYVRGAGRFTDRQMFPYPDLMLLDFNMPRCTGMQVLKSLNHRLNRPAVVLWSNTLDQIDVPLALGLGADLVCAKPACRRDLEEIVLRLKAKRLGKSERGDVFLNER